MSRIEHRALEPGAYELIGAIRDSVNGCLVEDVVNALVYSLAETVVMMEIQIDETDLTETIISALRGNIADMRNVQSTVQ